MKKAIALLLGVATASAFAASPTSGTTTGVLGNGSAITGTAQNAFGNVTLTLNAGAGGNNLTAAKGGAGTGVTASTFSAGLSVGSVLGGGVGGTGGTSGSAAGALGSLPKF